MKKSQVQESMKWREAIEWLLYFASIEAPEKLRPGDCLNLMDDLRRFIEDDGTGRLAQDLEEAGETPAKLKPAIEEVRKIVDAAADHKSVDIVPDVKTITTFDGAQLGTERGPITRDGTLKDAMAETAADDLGDAEPWQICRC